MTPWLHASFLETRPLPSGILSKRLGWYNRSPSSFQQQPGVVKEVARSASAGQGLTIRGIFVDAKVLQVALEANAKLQQSNAPPAYAVAPVFSPRVGSAGAPTTNTYAGSPGVQALWTAISTVLEETSCSFGTFFRAWRSAKTRKRLRRCRDVLPLPALHSPPDVLPTTAVEPAQLCDFVNWTIAGLNFLHANVRIDDVPDTFGSPPNAVQASAHRHILSRVARFLDRFTTAVPGNHQKDSRISRMAARLNMLI